MLIACAPVPTAQQGPSMETIVAATFEALTAAVPTPTSTPSGIVVGFENVSFIIPQGLALGATMETVPEVGKETGAPWDVAPEHIRFTFTSYNNALAKFSVMEIRVFRAEDYAARSAGAGNSIPRLQAILAAPDAPIFAESLPAVPYFNAGQMLAAQVARIEFKTGSGVRMVTQYGQAVGPITNNGTFYHFEGLTGDGKFYIVAVLPIGASFLASSDDPTAPLPADGIPFPDLSNTDPNVFETYFRNMEEKMNATDPNAFSPALSLLDALIQSIVVTP